MNDKSSNTPIQIGRLASTVKRIRRRTWLPLLSGLGLATLASRSVLILASPEELLWLRDVATPTRVAFLTGLSALLIGLATTVHGRVRDATAAADIDADPGDVEEALARLDALRTAVTLALVAVGIAEGTLIQLVVWQASGRLAAAAATVPVLVTSFLLADTLSEGYSQSRRIEAALRRYTADRLRQAEVVWSALHPQARWWEPIFVVLTGFVGALVAVTVNLPVPIPVTLEFAVALVVAVIGVVCVAYAALVALAIGAACGHPVFVATYLGLALGMVPNLAAVLVLVDYTDSPTHPAVDRMTLALWLIVVFQAGWTLVTMRKGPLGPGRRTAVVAAVVSHLLQWWNGRSSRSPRPDRWVGRLRRRCREFTGIPDLTGAPERPGDGSERHE